jgi:hypothetical protein
MDCAALLGLLASSSQSLTTEDCVTPADSLLLDAKQAILDEQHRRFQILHQEGRWEEALRQFQITMTCATDLLNDSLRLLEDTLERHEPARNQAGPPLTSN